jgi:hypothetical protein
MTKPMVKTETKIIPRRMLVVFGFDENQKPRAAQFESEFDLARKASDLMGLSVYETDDAKIRRRLKKLPQGKIYKSGWGFGPIVRQIQFDNLLKTTKAEKPKAPEPKPQATLPSSWKSIGVGDLVLGQADSASDGWWPAIVMAVDDDMLRSQARDFPEVPQVAHLRSAVALFFTPDYVPPQQEGNVAPGLPLSWEILVANHLVIAAEGKPQDGFWEAMVVKVDGDTLTLRWRDFPRLPSFKRHRHAVALLNPTSPSKN